MPFDISALSLKDTVIDTLRGLERKVSLSGGDVGLELEAEGTLQPVSTLYWKSLADGSLRNNGIEYIFKKPLTLEATKNALTEFEEFSENWVFNNSPRTSCHVHMNVQTFTFNEVYAAVGAYWLFEDILVEMCGKHRVGNLFCLRASDASASVTAVVDSVKQTLQGYNRHFIMDFQADYYKYAALNLAALCRFGSIEFRSMRGIYKKKDILPWVKLLHTLVHRAKAMGSPVKVYQVFKDASPADLVEAFFGEYSSLITEQPFWQDSIKKSSMFLAQLAFVVSKAERGEFTRPAVKEARFPKYSATLEVNWNNLQVSPFPAAGTPASVMNYTGLNSLKSRVIIDQHITDALPGPEGETLASPNNAVTYNNELLFGDY